MDNTFDLEQMLQDIYKRIQEIELVNPANIPNIDLYMDQVTTFMDKELRRALRDPEDKVLTKTMINNYTKNDLLPPPDKKKYSKEHLLDLMTIFYLKNFLAISDIRTLTKPLIDDFFGADNNEYSMEKIYREISATGRGARAELKKELDVRYNRVKDAFVEAPEESREYLKLFALVCQLSYDIFLKKSLIEHIADYMEDMQEEPGRAGKNGREGHRKKDK